MSGFDFDALFKNDRGEQVGSPSRSIEDQSRPTGGAEGYFDNLFAGPKYAPGPEPEPTSAPSDFGSFLGNAASRVGTAISQQAPQQAARIGGDWLNRAQEIGQGLFTNTLGGLLQNVTGSKNTFGQQISDQAGPNANPLSFAGAAGDVVARRRNELPGVDLPVVGRQDLLSLQQSLLPLPGARVGSLGRAAEDIHVRPSVVDTAGRALPEPVRPLELGPGATPMRAPSPTTMGPARDFTLTNREFQANLPEAPLSAPRVPFEDANRAFQRNLPEAPLSPPRSISMADLRSRVGSLPEVQRVPTNRELAARDYADAFPQAAEAQTAYPVTKPPIQIKPLGQRPPQAAPAAPPTPIRPLTDRGVSVRPIGREDLTLSGRGVAKASEVPLVPINELRARIGAPEGALTADDLARRIGATPPSEARAARTFADTGPKQMAARDNFAAQVEARQAQVKGPIAESGMSGPLVGRAYGRGGSQVARTGRTGETITAADLSASLERQSKVHQANEAAITAMKAGDYRAAERAIRDAHLLGGSMDNTSARLKAAGVPAPSGAEIRKWLKASGVSDANASAVSQRGSGGGLRNFAKEEGGSATIGTALGRPTRGEDVALDTSRGRPELPRITYPEYGTDARFQVGVNGATNGKWNIVVRDTHTIDEHLPHGYALDDGKTYASVDEALQAAKAMNEAPSPGDIDRMTGKPYPTPASKIEWPSKGFLRDEGGSATIGTALGRPTRGEEISFGTEKTPGAGYPGSRGRTPPTEGPRLFGTGNGAPLPQAPLGRNLLRTAGPILRDLTTLPKTLVTPLAPFHAALRHNAPLALAPSRDLRFQRAWIEGWKGSARAAWTDLSKSGPEADAAIGARTNQMRANLAQNGASAVQIIGKHTADEMVPSRILTSIPGFGRVFRAGKDGFTQFGNEARYAAAKFTIQGAKKGELAGGEGTRVFERINHFTGQGFDLRNKPEFAQKIGEMSAIPFFSPKLQASYARQIKDTLGALLHPTRPSSQMSLQLATGQLAATGGMLLAGAAAGLPIILNMTDSNFGKVDLGTKDEAKATLGLLASQVGVGTTAESNGHVYLDATHGMAGYVKALAETIANIAGGGHNQYGDVNVGDPIANLFINHLSPGVHEGAQLVRAFLDPRHRKDEISPLGAVTPITVSAPLEGGGGNLPGQFTFNDLVPKGTPAPRPGSAPRAPTRTAAPVKTPRR